MPPDMSFTPTTRDYEDFRVSCTNTFVIFLLSPFLRHFIPALLLEFLEIRLVVLAAVLDVAVAR